jgi:hypothetical protein
MLLFFVYYKQDVKPDKLPQQTGPTELPLNKHKTSVGVRCGILMYWTWKDIACSVCGISPLFRRSVIPGVLYSGGPLLRGSAIPGAT